MRPKHRANKKHRLVTNRGLLALNKCLLNNSQLTAKQLKIRLVLTSSTRTITRYCNKLGWNKIRTRYCQIVSFNNKVKRFIFACCAKLNKETFYNTIHIDECSVELRFTTIKNWNKKNILLRAAGGKVGKPKHPIKVHLWGGISRKGLTPLIIFENKMNSDGFQDLMKMGFLPFVEENFSDSHRLMMDQDPKHCSKSTKRFILRNDINYFESPPESPDLNPIEMVWNDLKYYLCTEVQPTTKDELVNGIQTFWSNKKNDIKYCNKKIDHLYKVIDRCIALTGNATGL